MGLLTTRVNNTSIINGLTSGVGPTKALCRPDQVTKFRAPLAPFSGNFLSLSFSSRASSTSTTAGSTNVKPFNVLFIGAGGINFGTPQGPWNHSTRLERRLDTRLKVVGIVDPFTGRSQEVIKTKTESFVKPAYENAKAWKDVDEAKEDLKGSEKWPDVIILGSPPQFRGTLSPGRNLEASLTQAFPNVPLFIEKPVSTDSVQSASEVAELLETRGTLVSVGYFLRYLQVVKKAKEIIDQNGLKVMATNARFGMAYTVADGWTWWDKSKQCGPVIEQATHLCDLSRFLANSEPLLPSVLAHSLFPSHPSGTGQLSKMPPTVLEAEGEGEWKGKGWIKEDDKIDRVSGAIWKYQNGAVGSLMHVANLHDRPYMTELEIYADGWLLKLSDFYQSPKLTIRSPGNDTIETFEVPDDDPYYAEIANFIDRIEGRPAQESPLWSSFSDATKTYALTWAIRLASEKSK